MAATAPASPPTRDWYSVDQAADYLGLSKWTIYRLAAAGDLSGAKTQIGAKAKSARWRFRQSDLDAYLERGRVTEPVKSTTRRRPTA